MIPTRFKRECIAELMKIGPMDETEAAKYFELGYQKAMEDWDSDIPIEETVEPAEFAEVIFDRVLEGEFDESVEIAWQTVKIKKHSNISRRLPLQSVWWRKTVSTF